MLEVARAALQAPRVSHEPRASDLLVDGLAVRFTDGYAASVPALKRAFTALREEGERKDVSVRWPWFARRVAAELFADDTWHYLTTRGVQLVRENGAVGMLPVAVIHLAHVRCLEGHLDGASAILVEADDISNATGTDPYVIGRLWLAGYRGIEAEALALFEAAERDAIARGGEGIVLTFSEHARAVLYNGLGRYEAALAPAQSAGQRDELTVSVWALPELVEAAMRCGQDEIATAAVASLSERTRAAGTELALGIEARSKALLSEGEVADRLYREAIDRLGRTRMALELARAHLLYGEWLRRTDGESTLATSSAVAGLRLARWALRRSRRARVASRWRQAKQLESAPTKPATSSPPKRRRSRGLPATGSRTPRSAPVFSSAHAPSSTTCTRCSPSSPSPAASTWTGRSPATEAPGAPAARPVPEPGPP